MIFKYNFIFDTKLIQSFVKIKNLKILDFGCGTGVWSNKNLRYKNIKKVTLYDNNKKLIKILKKKYSHKKIEVNFNFENIIKKSSYNLVIMSSVIQYINLGQFKKLIKNIFNIKKNKKKKLFIIITDIPNLPRPIEFFLMPIFNIKRFIFVLTMIFNKEYKKINFNLYKKKDFYFLKKDFQLSFKQNIHDLKYLRYTLILKSK